MMTLQKPHVQLTAMLVLLACSMAGYAEDINKNANKNNRASDTVSDVYITGDAHGHTEPAIATPAGDVITAEHNEHRNNLRQIEKEWQQQRQEAYQRHLQRRQQFQTLVPDSVTDTESRRKDYVNHMQQRRQLIDHMNEQRRKAIEERRENMRLKMHQTRTETPAPCRPPA